jgi:hypothetical protein
MQTMSKKLHTFERNIVADHDRDDGFSFLCRLEQQQDYHGDKNLQKSCQELRAAQRRRK